MSRRMSKVLNVSSNSEDGDVQIKPKASKVPLIPVFKMVCNSNHNKKYNFYTKRLNPRGPELGSATKQNH